MHRCREHWLAPRQVSITASEHEGGSPGPALPMLRLPGGTKPLWGLKGLSHAARRVQGSCSHDCAEEWARGLPCPGMHKSDAGWGDVTVTFRARQGFCELCLVTWSPVVTRERSSAASLDGVRNVPCHRAA